MPEFMSEPERNVPFQQDISAGEVEMDIRPFSETSEPDGVRFDMYRGPEFVPEGYTEAAIGQSPPILDVREYDDNAYSDYGRSEARHTYDNYIRPLFWRQPDSREFLQQHGPLLLRNVIRTVTDERGTTVLEIGNNPGVVDVTFTDIDGATSRHTYYVDTPPLDAYGSVRRHDHAADMPLLPAEGTVPTSVRMRMQYERRNADVQAAVRDHYAGPEEVRNLVDLAEQGTPPQPTVNELRVLFKNRTTADEPPDQNEMLPAGSIFDNAVYEALREHSGVNILDRGSELQVGSLTFNDPAEGRMRLLLERSRAAGRILTVIHIRPEAQGTGEAQKAAELKYAAYGSTFLATSGSVHVQADHAEAWCIRDLLRAAVKQQSDNQQ
jgi:hypothetical protein